MEFVIFIAFSIQFSALENPSMHPVSVVGGTVGNGTTPIIARGWTSGGTGISGLRMLLSRSTGHRCKPENGFCSDARFCPNLCSQTEAHSSRSDFRWIYFRSLVGFGPMIQLPHSYRSDEASQSNDRQLLHGDAASTNRGYEHVSGLMPII